MAEEELSFRGDRSLDVLLALDVSLTPVHHSDVSCKRNQILNKRSWGAVSDDAWPKKFSKLFEKEALWNSLLLHVGVS